MKRSVLHTLALATLLLAGCAQPSDNKDKGDSGGDSSTTSSYKVSIDFPKSLLGTDSESSASVARSLAARAAEGSTTSYAYDSVKQAIEILTSSAKSNATQGVLLQTVIEQNSLAPSAATVTGKTVTITQELIDAFLDSIPESDQEDTSELQEALGMSIDVPDFVYQTSDNTNFDYRVTTTETDENEDGTTVSTETTFYWTKDLSRTAVKFSDGVMAYDGDTESAYMSFDSEDGDMKFEMAAVVDSSNADAHGVYLKQSFTVGEDKGSLTVYADDSGGLAKNTFTGSSYSGSFTEGFDSTGSVTYQALDFSEGMDDQTTGELSASYSAKLDGAPASFGTAETLF